MLYSKVLRCANFFNNRSILRRTQAYIIYGGTGLIRESVCCNLIKQYPDKNWVAHNDHRGTLIIIFISATHFGAITPESMERMARRDGVVIDLNNPRYLLYSTNQTQSFFDANSTICAKESPQKSEMITFKIEPTPQLKRT